MEKIMTKKVDQPTFSLWGSLSRESAFKVWCSDLERAVEESKNWGLVGQAVVIEANDEEIVSQLIQHRHLPTQFSEFFVLNFSFAFHFLFKTI